MTTTESRSEARSREDVLLGVDRFEQPDEETCGPASLAAVYAFFGLSIPIERIAGEIPPLPGGGTVCVFLGQHALRSGFEAILYPQGLQIFDPTWIELDAARMIDKLRRRRALVADVKLRQVVQGYVDFLEAGGSVQFRDLTPEHLHELLLSGLPVLTGVCSTYLYRTSRVAEGRYDDVGGDAEGHFVIVCGSRPFREELVIVDPSRHVPFSPEESRYSIDASRLVRAILMGESTHDAVYLTIRPASSRADGVGSVAGGRTNRP